jgi:hypothetical protein
VSDATEDFHDADLPDPTFQNSLNAKDFRNLVGQSTLPLVEALPNDQEGICDINFSRSLPSRSASAKISAAQASTSAPFRGKFQSAAPQRASNAPGPSGASEDDEDEETLPPMWSKLILHMRTTRDRQNKRRAVSLWRELSEMPLMDQTISPPPDSAAPRPDDAASRKDRAACKRAVFLSTIMADADRRDNNGSLDDIC